MAVWNKKVNLVDIFHNDAYSFEEKRDEIVRRLKIVFPEDTWEIEDLASTEDEDDFDEVWDSVYDLADAQRVWIATF